ncbi:toprim domain-containing protein [Bacillaceae bacterium W0354]
MDQLEKVLIVEGKQDRNKIKNIIDDDVLILCTFGTIGLHAIDEMIDQYQLFERDVFIFTDTDESGESLRKLLNRELSHATNLFIDKKYRQVEDTPDYVLATILQAANINVKLDFLKGSDYRE